MASPSVTYSFSNGSTSDASQVNQNFTDLINGVTDGTKDLNISALTCAGTTTLNGHITLGSGSADDLTVNASLASSVPIKTTNSYDIGSSSLALRAVYLNTLYVRDTSAAYDVPVVFTSSPTISASRTLTVDMVNAARTVKLGKSVDFTPSKVRVTSGNGHGSTNTKIRRFNTTEVNTGSAITYADSATNGGSFTINTTGLYFISYTDSGTDGGQINVGASRNSAQLTTDVESITYTDRLFYVNERLGNPQNPWAMASTVVSLTATDVIRAHTNNNGQTNSDNRTVFEIALIH